MKQNYQNTEPELRYNVRSKTWVLFAPKRGVKKHNDFLTPKFISQRKKVPASSCPFENLKKSGNDKPFFVLPERGPWKVQVLPNKFPALSLDWNTYQIMSDMYFRLPGYGYHDLLILRSHTKPLSALSVDDLVLVLSAMQKRYRQTALDEHIAYVSLFHNWGPRAGASLYHPHLQMLSLPVIPADVEKSLDFVFDFFKKTKTCAYCSTIAEEIKNKNRVVVNTARAVALAPFASREPLSVSVFPKHHGAFFEDASSQELTAVAGVLKAVLISLKKNAHDPDFNLFIHTAPVKNKQSYGHYHWHVEIVPKLNTSAGFELGTGIEINPMFPEEAAHILRIV